VKRKATPIICRLQLSGSVRNTAIFLGSARLNCLVSKLTPKYLRNQIFWHHHCLLVPGKWEKNFGRGEPNETGSSYFSRGLRHSIYGGSYLCSLPL